MLNISGYGVSQNIIVNRSILVELSSAKTNTTHDIWFGIQLVLELSVESLRRN